MMVQKNGKIAAFFGGPLAGPSVVYLSTRNSLELTQAPSLPAPPGRARIFKDRILTRCRANPCRVSVPFLEEFLRLQRYLTHVLDRMHGSCFGKHQLLSIDETSQRLVILSL